MTQFMRFIGFVLLFVPAVALSQGNPPSLFVVHFQTGDNWLADKAPAEQKGFSEHSANLGQLRKAGIIVFGARYDKYGMIIIESESLESATALIAKDPGVEAEIFDFTVAPLNVFYSWQHQTQ